METTKIRLKKNATSLMGVVTMILIVMIAFFAGFTYIQNNANSAGITIDSKYNDSYTRLESAQTDLSENVNDIEASLNDITEASDIFQVAWNGLKGLGNTLKLPITFVSTSLAVWSAVIPGLGFLPDFVLPIAFIAITAFIVFLVLSILKGEPKLSS